MTIWILMIYLYGYSTSAPVMVADYTTLARCEAAGAFWTKSNAEKGNRRAWACIPDR